VIDDTDTTSQQHPAAAMYSTFQRLNQLSSLATTAVMVLLGLISLASWYHQPTPAPGKIDVKSLMM
jgi:signal peptidase complex subunit 3